MKAPPEGDPLEFDLHGVVGIRVVGAGPAEARAVRAQLGPVERPPARDPDVAVRFVPRFPLPRLRHVDPGKSGVTDDGYVVLSHRRRPVVARMPFEAGSPAYEIVCERGARRVPMLEEWLRLAALDRGHVPLHASAFEHRGIGVLVAGGPQAGKTSSVLAFASPDTRFVSDDLVLLAGDGSRMLGVATDLALADWQLDQLPEPRRRLGALRRALLAGTRRLEGRRGGALGTVAHAVVPAVRRRLKVSVPPGAIFGHVGPCVAEPRKVFLAVSHASPAIEVEPADPGRVAAHLAAGLRLELQALFGHYRAFRSAFPERRSEPLESAEARAEALLRRALADREVFLLRHPHPVSLEALRRAMEPFVRGPGAAARTPPSPDEPAAYASSSGAGRGA